MDAVSAYSFGNLGWLSLQAVPLIIWPSFISSLLRPDYQHASPLENYFARSLGFSLLALGLTVVVLSGAVPLTSVLDGPADQVSPYASAVLVLSTIHHSASGFYCYSQYFRLGQTAFMMGCLGSSIFAVFGLWCLMFAGDKTRIGKKNGYDKNTSGFPFANSESYKTKKKGL